jgi:phage terminase large subunit-like protein
MKKFELFYAKYLEMGGIDSNKARAGAIWFVMVNGEKEQAFQSLCSEGTKEIFAVDYLKLFLK